MARKTQKKGLPKWIPFVIIGIAALACFYLWRVFGGNTGSFAEGEYLYIPTGSNYEQLKTALVDGGFVKNEKTFDMVAKNSDLPNKVKAGKYKIEKGMSNYDIVKMLKNGSQEPVKLVINKVRTKQDFIKLLDKKFEADSLHFATLFSDQNFLSQYNLNPENMMAGIMPNTYEIYWNTQPEKIFKKIAQSYISFWNEERKSLAKAKNLTPQEAITIASIVEEETNKNDEKPTVASVYLNRLNQGMKLQADPTARFAYGDFTIKRVTSVHTSLNSPYNTYYVTGLPPGPICTPSKSSIEAVIKAPETKYLYFCAKEDFSGYHSFATTYAEHLANAKKYQNALNQRGIK